MVHRDTRQEQNHRLLQHDFLAFDIWPKAQPAWQLQALTRPGCKTPAAYLHVRTSSARPAPALNPRFPAGRAIHIPLATHGESSVADERAPLGGGQAVPQHRTHRSHFGTKRLMSRLGFDTLNSELGTLVNTLQSYFWAGFHPYQFLCTRPLRQLIMISGQRYNCRCTPFISSQPLTFIGLLSVSLRRLFCDYD